MTTETPDDGEGFEMDGEEIETFLGEQGVGVLSLAREDEAYGVPISFGYDGDDRLYFVFLGIGERSRKAEFAEATERASFVTYDVGSKHDWTSAVASGRVREVSDDEWETLESSIEDNAWYPSLFSEADPMQGVQGWVLEIEELTGRRSEG
jgi:hypothetical protein